MLGQDLKARDQSEVIFEALRGILPVSRLIMLVGSGLPMGPRQIMLGCSDRGMKVEFPKGLEIMAKKGEIKNSRESQIEMAAQERMGVIVPG